MVKKKISDLQEITNPQDLWVLVTDDNNESKKFNLNNLTGSGSGIGLDLENVIYAHGGSEDDFAKTKPALLRGDPYAQIITGYNDTDTNFGRIPIYGIPRMFMYFNGKLYDDAPAGYVPSHNPAVVGNYQASSAVVVNVGTLRRVTSYRLNRIYFYLDEEMNPCTGAAMDTHTIKWKVTNGATAAVVRTGPRYFQFIESNRTIEWLTPTLNSGRAIGTASVGRTNSILNQAMQSMLDAAGDTMGVLNLLQ